MDPRPTNLPALALVLVAVLWGVTFSVTARALTDLPPAYVVTLRFGIAALLLTALTRHAPPPPGPLHRRAVGLGSLLGLGFLLQTWALQYTDSVRSGFLTGLLVVIAPVLDAAIFRRRTRWTTWTAVGLALLGLVILGVRGAGSGRGDLLTIAAAAVWALHLVLLSRWSVPAYAMGLARTQTTAVAGLALLAAGLGAWSRPGPAVTPITISVSTWVLIGFLAVLSTAVPMVLLTWAQARVDATRTAVLLTLEPVAAAVTGAAAGVALDVRTVLGGAILVVAMAAVARQPMRSAPESSLT